MPGGKGGGGGSGGTQVVKNRPFDAQLPFIKNLFEESQQAFNAVPRRKFESDLVARPSENQLTGLGKQAEVANQFEKSGAANQTSNLGNQLGSRVQNNTALAPATAKANIPGVQSQEVGNLPQVQAPSQQQDFSTLQETTQAAIQPLQENLTENVLPQLESQAIQQGAFGGSRQALGEQEALDQFQEQAGNQASQLALQDLSQRRNNELAAQQTNQQASLGAQRSNQQADLSAQQQNQQAALEDLNRRTNAFQNGLQLQNQTAQLVPQLQNQALQQALGPAQLQQQVGAQEQQFAQDLINEQVAKFEQEQQLPFKGFDQFRASVGNPLGQNQITEGGGGNSPLSNAISGGLGGASSGLALAGGIGGLSAGTGAIAGGGLGALAGLLSDRRLKHDITRLQSLSLANGKEVNLYSFKWNGTQISSVGFMADEIAEALPEAVSETIYGLQMVNYSEVLKNAAD